MAEQSHTEEAFLKAYESHSDALFRYILFRISDSERAAELVQDVFLKTWKYISDGQTVDNIKAFLYKTAGNIVIDEYRRRKSEDSLEALEENIRFEVSFDDTDAWADRLDGAQAITMLGTLPKDYRDAVYLRFVEELSISEIAQITGQSENLIGVRIHRGIAKLQKIFNHQ